MNPDNKTKFDRLILRERIRAIAPAAALSVLFLTCMALYVFDQSVSEKTVASATVQSWSRLQTEGSNSDYLISAELTDGTHVLVTASEKGRSPKHGEVIKIEKRKSDIGRTSYHWNRSNLESNND